MQGKIIVKLNEFLIKNNISRTSLARDGKLRYDTILSYCNGDISRFDSDTLAKMCFTLNCNVSDILEFVPDEQ